MDIKCNKKVKKVHNREINEALNLIKNDRKKGFTFRA